MDQSHIDIEENKGFFRRRKNAQLQEIGVKQSPIS
jgi:hypothetical protein